MMTRSELIEKARAWLRESDWQPGGAMGARPTAEYYADFCLPLLAAERELAIEEAAQCLEARAGWAEHAFGMAHDGALTVRKLAECIRVLARANEKPGTDSLAEYLGRTSADSPSPASQRQRVKELLCAVQCWDGPSLEDAMLAYGAERVQEDRRGRPYDRVIEDIKSERELQDAQWGGPEHDDEHTLSDWRAYIGRQLDFARTRTNVRDRLVKVAALAVAAIESMDRKEGALARANEKEQGERRPGNVPEAAPSGGCPEVPLAPPASPAQRQRAEELLREANICAQPGNVHSHRVDAMVAYGAEREAPLLEEVQTWKRAADYWWDATRRNGEQLKAAHARGAREALKKLRAEFSYDAYMNGMSIRSCIDKQLAALPRPGETETTLGSSASDPRAEASGSAASGENEQPVSNRKDAGSSPAPGTISDAETLEHAATIIHRKLGMDETASVLNLYAAGLRARSAPPEATMLPLQRQALERAQQMQRTLAEVAYHAEKSEELPHELYCRVQELAEPLGSPPPEADVFEAVAREWYGPAERHGCVPGLAALLRDRFSPLVEALEKIAGEDRRERRLAGHRYAELAEDALAALRGAKETSK